MEMRGQGSCLAGATYCSVSTNKHTGITNSQMSKGTKLHSRLVDWRRVRLGGTLASQRAAAT